MNTHSDKTPENKNQVVVNGISNQSKGGESTFQFVDNRPETIAQRKLQSIIQKQGIEEEEPLQGKFETLQKKAPEEEEEELLQGKFIPIQMKAPEEEEMLQGKFEPVQKQGLEEEEPLQGKFIPVQMKAPEEEELLQGKFETVQKKENNTGLPDNLKSGIENLSGYSLDDVKVNLNSNKPAQLNAHAYAQGTDIHVAPGQEKHLPHEAWHVVQQKQGRVKPTMQMKGNVNVNDDEGLEKEADVMGAKAIQMTSEQPQVLTHKINKGKNSKSTQLKIIQLEKYPNFQTFFDTDGTEWCSLKKVNSHAEGSEWIGDICSRYGVSVNGKPTVKSEQPSNANWRSGIKYG